MSRLLRRAGFRYLLRHPWQLVLSVLGVALGVAVVVAIDLANQSAERAFGLSMDAVTGKATHEIVGGPRGIDEKLYRDLRVDLGLEAIAPVVEGTLAVAGHSRLLRVLGIDPFAEAPFRPHLGRVFKAGGVSLDSFLVKPYTAVLAADTAERLGLRPGDDLEVRVGTRRENIELAGLLRGDSAREREALGDLLVVDVSVAQELFSLEGRLSRIDLRLAPASERAEVARIAAKLPVDAQLRSAAGRTRALASMTRAFRLNLTALSLLALVVGMFLIYNAMTFAVVQRRTQIGMLRALGVTRRQITLTVLGEAGVLGMIGTSIGVGLGIVMGAGLVRLVTTTINDLYFVLTVTGLDVSLMSLGKGIALGLGTTLLAAIVPSLEAAGAAPRQALDRSVLEERWRRGAPIACLVGVTVSVGGGLLLSLSGRNLVLSFAGIFALVVGLALVVPLLTVVLIAMLRPLARRAAGVLGSMAARGVVSALSRTGVAISALMIAVSVTVGVGIMIDSFRKTVVRWLSTSLVADVYVSPPDLTVGNAPAGLDEDLVARLTRVSGARASANVRRVDLPKSNGGVTRLVVLGVDDDTRPGYQLTEGSFDSVWPAFRQGNGVLVSEPYARRNRVSVGDDVELPTDRGKHAYRILGIYYDYSTELGLVAMHRSAYLRSWDDGRLTGVAFYLEPSTDIQAFMDSLVVAAGAERAIRVRSNRAIREESIAIFDRTFTVTAVLRLLVVIVAFVGVLSALMALQLERVREFGVLRANGMTPGQARQLVVMQTGLMGLAAGLFSLPVGLLLAWVMIHVINLRAFGWSLSMAVSPSLLAQGVAVSIGASMVAGLYPAWKLGGTSPARALREE